MPNADTQTHEINKMLTICYGTRPEYTKVEPLVAEIRRRGKNVQFVRILQHTTLFDEDKEKSDLSINVFDSGQDDRLNDIIQCVLRSSMLTGIFKNSSHVLVQGDTATAFACALKAFNLGIPVIHLEAGLRSGDLENPWPEESYRRMISSVTALHLCPTEMAIDNLRYEFDDDVSAVVVGNTVLDNLKGIKPTEGNHVVCTIHRRENEDKRHWFSELNKLAGERNEQFMLVTHPSIPRDEYKGLDNLTTLYPMGHNDFIDLLASCKFVISDSGGLQEEASFLGKKILVCRETTERPEIIAINHGRLCSRPEDLKFELEKLEKTPRMTEECPFGTGESSILIADELQKWEII